MGWIDEMLVGVPVNAVLRERLTLEAEKRGATLEENIALKSENAALRSENEVLKSQVVNLRQEIQRRDDVIQKKETHGQHLEEAIEKLLVALSAGGELQADQLAQALGIGEQLATFHLNEMEKVRLVSAAMFYTGRPSLWRIAQEGRSYLVAHGLLT